jgi:hypothetical protein
MPHRALLLLGHAADNGEDFAPIALEVLQTIENLLLGLVTNAARVIENVLRREQRADEGPSSGGRKFRCKASFPRAFTVVVPPCWNHLAPHLIRL